MTNSPDGPIEGEDQEHGTPRWVKVLGVAGLVIVLLILLMLFGGGQHGPHRHFSGGGPGGAAVWPGISA